MAYRACERLDEKEFVHYNGSDSEVHESLARNREAMHPQEFTERLHAERACAILRTDSEVAAREAMRAAIRGGFRIVEFTMSIPNATGLIREFSKDPQLVVGAGTVLNTREVREVCAAGAQFVVSPVLDRQVLLATQTCGVAFMPGCGTPTEMWQAYQAGVQLQKLFPEQATGPTWVRQCLGPLPFLKIVPTSGITLENAADYLAAGAYAVGFTTFLFIADDVKQGRFDRIEERARQMLKAVQSKAK
jgi:Entner-Doudoroff aldolase